MKRPDRKETGLLAALLLALGAAGCGGINASVPVSPMMFIQNPAPQSGPAVLACHTPAVHNAPLKGP